MQDDKEWHDLVTKAMIGCFLPGQPKSDADIIAYLLRAGFSLGDIRDHFEDVKKGLKK